MFNFFNGCTGIFLYLFLTLTIIKQTVRHTTQAPRLLWLTKSRINSVCWVECLHLLLSHAGEIQPKYCIYCHVSQEVKQMVLIYIAINSVECLHIAACWRDTQHKHCGIYCDSLKWSKQCLLLLLSGVPVLSAIVTCWRDILQLLLWPLKIDDINWSSSSFLSINLYSMFLHNLIKHTGFVEALTRSAFTGPTL